MLERDDLVVGRHVCMCVHNSTSSGLSVEDCVILIDGFVTLADVALH